MEQIGSTKAYITPERRDVDDQAWLAASKVFVGQVEIGRIYKGFDIETFWFVGIDGAKCCGRRFTTREKAVEVVRDELEAE